MFIYLKISRVDKNENLSLFSFKMAIKTVGSAQKSGSVGSAETQQSFFFRSKKAKRF